MAAEAHEAKFQPLPKAYISLSGLKLPTFAHSEKRRTYKKQPFLRFLGLSAKPKAATDLHMYMFYSTLPIPVT